MEAVAVPMEALFKEYADKRMIDEATKFSAAPTGAYDLQIKKVECRERDGRKVAHIQGQLGADGRKRGTVFFDISWVEGRTSTGKLDRTSRLWGQLVTALFPDEKNTQVLADKSVGEILDLATKYPLRAFVTEAFKVPDATKVSGYAYVTPRSDEEVTDFRKKGYDSTNFVQSISKAVNG